MGKVLAWVGIVLTLPTVVLFGIATLTLLAQGDIGAAVVGVIMTALVGAVTWWCVRVIKSRRGARARTAVPGPSTPSIPTPAPVHRDEPTPARPEGPISAPASLDREAEQRVEPSPPAEPIRTAPRVPARRPAARRRSGRPGLSLAYAETGGSEAHDGPFAVVDVETTGFSATGDDRVVEVAVVRVDGRGQIEDEWATLVNPGRDTGPVFVHHISNDAVADAPSFADVADDLLARLSGAVVVAHNATFDESFLRAELARAGYSGLEAPGLCSLWLSRRTLQAPNYKLGTLGKLHDVASIDAHSALGDARTVARLMPIMLDKTASPLSYGCRPYAHQRTGSTAARIVTRASSLRKGEVGWMNNLVDRLPLTANEISDDVAHRYLEAMAHALSDGRITGDEAKELARIAGRAGLGGMQVRALNEQFLEGLREAAFEDDVLTPQELTQLQRASTALGVDGYFDDLVVPVTTVPVRSEPAVDGLRAASDPDIDPAEPAVGGPATSDAVATKRVRRCGYCRQPGHYRTTCPELVS